VDGERSLVSVMWNPARSRSTEHLENAIHVEAELVSDGPGNRRSVPKASEMACCPIDSIQWGNRWLDIPVLVFDVCSETSRVALLDARSPELGPMAQVRTTCRWYYCPSNGWAAADLKGMQMLTGPAGSGSSNSYTVSPEASCQ